MLREKIKPWPLRNNYEFYLEKDPMKRKDTRRKVFVLLLRCFSLDLMESDSSVLGWSRVYLADFIVWLECSPLKDFVVSNRVLHFVNMSKRLVAFSRQHFWYVPRAGISWSRFLIIESQIEVSQPDDERMKSRMTHLRSCLFHFLRILCIVAPVIYLVIPEVTTCF